MSKKKVKSKTVRNDDFKSVARRLECDEDRIAFEKKLGKIARAKLDHGGLNAKSRSESKG